jgi:hypothetical protein
MTRKSKGLLIDSEELAHALQEVLSGASLRARQKFSMHLGKSIDERLRQIVPKIITVIRDALSEWKRRQCYPPVLPNGTRMYIPTMDGCFNIVIEEPPRVRSLKIWPCVTKKGSTRNGREAKVFSLSLPYIIFVFRFNSERSSSSQVRVFCRTRSLQHQLDTLYNFPLTNVSPGDGHICMTGTELPDRNQPISAWVDEFRTTFWQSEFTQDYNDNICWLASNRSSHFSSLDTWARWSASNPADVLKIKFQPLDDVLKSYLIPQDESGILNNLHVGVLRNIKDCVEQTIAKVYEDSMWDYFSDMLVENPKLVQEAMKILQGYLDDATVDIRQVFNAEIADELGKLEKKIEIEASKILGESPKIGSGEADMSDPW